MSTQLAIWLTWVAC